MKKIFLCSIFGLLFITSNLFADLIVEKDPNAGVYAGLGHGSYIYANSFIFNGTTGTTLDTLGVWLLGGSDTSTLIFELLADTGPDSPDLTQVLTSSIADSFALTSLTLETEAVTPYALTNGMEYWVAIVATGTGSAYSLAQHQQNSEGINDNGTFWYSNDSTYTFFSNSSSTEMAIYAADSSSAGTGGGGGLGGNGDAPSATPEPATWAGMLIGLSAVAWRMKCDRDSRR